MRKLRSNTRKLEKLWMDNRFRYSDIVDEHQLKVLGLNWNFEKDELSLEISGSPKIRNLLERHCGSNVDTIKQSYRIGLYHQRLLLHLSNTCINVLRSTILRSYHVNNNVSLMHFWIKVILQQCCIPNTCDKACFHTCGSTPSKKYELRTNVLQCHTTQSLQIRIMSLVIHTENFHHSVNADIGVYVPS
ncbi:hypothetical protein NPIL_204701 [Nephila pilipes]|uniref:Uncharacterized protein n=1 Tax=Nephila pilipes TaxID=299642 RepID=A0A8X6NHL8_NEPPI|nr:hypothetical protein NPIL_401621 [Nephila pilipes]GFT66037.1 hypothetical protein NPIL_509041 [Nephila pilipes]GFU10759.1 hypothetical protein NPIL_30131 [Nephila pilipes]GFU37818.1 hypothetical protein NPIL_204701 [Nephila pilipes]